MKRLPKSSEFRKWLPALVFIFGSALSFAQSTHMNAVLIRALHKDATKVYPVLVKGNVAKVKQYTEAHQGLYKYHCGDISSLCLKGTDLLQLVRNNYVSRIEYYEKCQRPLDDTSIIKNNVLKIHNGATPLAQGYDGKGVTFGLVDSGIDFTHPDFQDSTGKTRVKWLWDQTLSSGGVTPQPYNYGQEWDNVQIDSGHCTHSDIYDMGHGTKVSGVAAGNGRSDSIFKGIAPKTDIIVAALDFSSTGPVALDGINYVVTKAIALGQPFVLNLSIGDYYGSHDGLDLQAQAIDALFANIPGRCVVAAAGNAGDIPFHLQYNLSADTNFTFIYNASSNLMEFSLYADTNNFKQANYSIGVCDNQTFRYVGNIGFRDITSCLGITLSDTLWNANHDRIGIIETTADIIGGSYELLASIKADSAQFYWTLENTGVGSFDAWNFDFMDSISAVGTAVSNIAFYKAPDTFQTICSSFQCSEEVITVANYTERSGHIGLGNVYVMMPDQPDTLVYNSSIGPTRDNRIKPDIAATGNNIMTCGTIIVCQAVIQFWVPPATDILSADTIHMKFDGTSAASPAVAGFAALYLQKNPTATNKQIRDAIRTCARHDAFTGNSLPDLRWGYGKLDGFNALLCGSMSAQNALLNHEKLNVYPNPASEQVQFIFEKEQGMYDIKIYSVLGNEVKTIKSSEKSTVLSVQNFPQGLYLYKIFQNQTLINEGKFVKE